MALDASTTSDSRASLIVVGTGIQWRGQTTLAAQHAIQHADCVLYALADPWGAQWLRTLNPRATSFEYPRTTLRRSEIYAGMSAAILAQLEAGQRVCAVFYGSPTYLTEPAHLAVTQAHARGFSARILPGVSSAECLFADLNVDPARGGYQVFEAREFLLQQRRLDPRSHVVLCQIALIDYRGVYDGDMTRGAHGLRELCDRLVETYPAEHEVVVYEAATHPLVAPRIEPVTLARLAGCELHEISTLYVPPVTAREQQARSTRRPESSHASHRQQQEGMDHER